MGHYKALVKRQLPDGYLAAVTGQLAVSLAAAIEYEKAGAVEEAARNMRCFMRDVEKLRKAATKAHRELSNAGGPTQESFLDPESQEARIIAENDLPKDW